jgi:putative two-component system response regulator
MSNENTAVALLSERLALACGYNSAMAKLIKWAALFHDVGKSEVPQAIIHKPGKLLPCEFEIMKQHTKHGARLLSCIPGERGKVAVDVAFLHHEWFNGQGYWGHKASEIPMFAGIVAVCDVYVALRSIRSYKQAWSASVALEYINNRAGTQFCPKVVKNFNSLVC